MSRVADRSESPLVVDSLSITFASRGAGVTAVDNVSYSVGPGEIVAVVGESGSGKSVTALAALGLLPEAASVSGSLRIEGEEVLTMTPRQLRALRGQRAAMVFQDPMTSLNPSSTVGEQIVEAIRAHRAVPVTDARARAVKLLRDVGIPEPERRFSSYPHQLSGGQRQRVVIAIALSCEPNVLIADEPTTALDVTVQAEILELLRSLRERLGMSVLIITHNMGVVADIADRVVVMRAGRVVEQGDVAQIFGAAEHEYTRSLLAAVPVIGEREHQVPVAGPPETVLELRDVSMVYPGRRGVAVHALDGVSLSVGRGEMVGVVGESGSGKSTLGRIAVRLLDPTSGSVHLDDVDITRFSARRMRPLRRRIAMVFQDPGSSLDPRRVILDSVAEPLLVHRMVAGVGEARRQAAEMLDAVGLSAALVRRFPHELSGGQRQRVAIARAIIVRPEMLVADEPTSALDVSVQARILDTLRSLQADLGFSCLLITHDLGVVDQMTSRVAVMKSGRLVEEGPTGEVLRHSSSEYTRLLVAAAPVPDPSAQRTKRAMREALSQGAARS